MYKYLFIVHSSITRRMAAAIMEYHKLDRADCILLSDRGFYIEANNINTLDISRFSILPFRWGEKGKLLKTCRTNRKHYAALQELLEEQIGMPFHLFLPHSWSYTYLTLIEHDLCLQYAFMEEGTLTYNPNLETYRTQASWGKRILLRIIVNACLNSSLTLFPQPFTCDHAKYRGCYGISTDSFPTLPDKDKYVLPPPFNLRREYQLIEQVLITGPWIELEYCDEIQYRQLKTALFQFFVREGIQTIYVKFHPIQYYKRLSIPIFWEIAKQFADRIKVLELSKTASPEEIAFSSEADFYLAYSSVAIYASQFDCRVLSYATPMYKHWPAFRRVFDSLPPVIKEQMTYIDLKIGGSVKNKV